MARIAAGQVVFVSNEDTDEAIPVKLVGGVEVELGANVGILNIANVVIDPSTEGKQDDGITILTTIDTDTGNMALALGATTDAAADAAGAGSVPAQLRRLTTDLAAANVLLALLATAAVDTNWFQATFTSADAQSAAPVKAKTAAKKIHVTDIIISVDTQMSVQLQSDNGSPQIVMEGVYLSADGGFTKTFNPRFPLVVNTNEDLDVITSAAGNISVTVTGYVV